MVAVSQRVGAAWLSKGRAGAGVDGVGARADDAVVSELEVASVAVGDLDHP